MKKKNEELEKMKADMAEAHSALTKAVDDASSQRDAAEWKLESAGVKLESAEAKLETLKGSVQLFVAAIFGKSVEKNSVHLEFFLRL